MEDRLSVILNRIEQRSEQLLEKQKRMTDTTKALLSEGSLAGEGSTHTGSCLNKRQATQ